MTEQTDTRHVTRPFAITAKDGKARAGILYTRHGAVKTPIFMPVATQASVKSLSGAQLDELGPECLLSNTYHLYLRPGTEILEQSGGLHNFMKYKGSILTDSGGFQVYSLSQLRKIKEEGVFFKSHIDGSGHMFTPENVIRHQSKIGSDIWTCLDVCVENPATRAEALKALKTTQRWALRAVDEYWKTVPEQQITQTEEHTFETRNPLLFGIVQGSIYEDMRREAAEFHARLPFHGFCIGGLAVGEEKAQMAPAVAAAVEPLPEQAPRYFMGLGTPEDIWNMVELGVDMFDCVLPTRNARNGQALTSRGKLQIKNAPYRNDQRPLDPACNCYTCRTHTKAYLCHLFRANELLSHTLLSLHNVHFLLEMMRNMRTAIEQGRFAQAKREFLDLYLSQTV
ncbi:MAG: tRNA guanosine(34) transglycosylase Tgt [Elusimicrobia bacterium]|nr:tRNA guanosine(34) transglycosylase Tgt [Elusimicrobiota bacterium]